ncbi:MAG: hypothetical protein K9K65_17205 [Desulfarculaceae bacterium]|nr:hypothetical protein [Desulfarculaceae bacterium]MCF8048064.1 hypothetical protein [Desulfarculaceae bacterium]MCF8099581.1 hypothetical protein [Desulfarculaceae bacterium]MCF8123649.1 hypothetical protein [Desulfarculaceae bacterium]
MFRRTPALLMCLAALWLTAMPAWAAPKQDFFFRVMDSRDRLVPGARMEVRPLAGHPKGGPVFAADKTGVIRLEWLPLGKEALPGSHDQVTRWASAFHWRIFAPGFLSAVGAINQETTSRTMADPLLAKMNQTANTAPHGETVLLRRPGEMFAWSEKEHPLEGPLSAACKDLHLKDARVARRLGASFAWPAFALSGDTLEIRFDWVGAPWGNQAKAPLTGKVALLTGLPLMIAAGQDLPPLPQVKNLRLVFNSSIAPPDDDYAMPVPAKVIMQAPVEAVRRLGAGELGAREFMGQFPPRLEGGPPPKPAPAQDEAKGPGRKQP